MKRAFWILGFFLVSCGGDQLSGSLQVAFQSTEVCDTKRLVVPFQNPANKEVVIEGAAISPGTDPAGNFTVESVVVGGEETVAIGGAIPTVSIPAQTEYKMNLLYNPKEAGSPDTAIVDIVYREPQGVFQLNLSGESTGDSAGCVSRSEGVEVGFDGAQVLTVSKLMAATSQLSQLLSSEDGREPFQPTPLTLTLDKAEKKVTLQKIEVEDHLVLPRPKEDVPTLGRATQQDTVITSLADGEGLYDASEGSLTLSEVSVRLDGDFNATVTVTLTTGEVLLSDLNPPIHADAIKKFGVEHYDFVTKDRIFGSPIDPETGKVVLVGTTKVSDFEVDPGASSLFRQLGGTTLAILIEGTISSESD